MEWIRSGTSEAQLRPLEAEGNGYFAGWIAEARPGERYRLSLDDAAYPDPASRFQPEGPHGPSEIINPAEFTWTDRGWRGRPTEELVVYELHLGTFTPEGTWAAASARLPQLQRLGITALEIMPVADFPGRFGWGYDGVNHFAPCRLYGRPDDARAFVDRAHALGLMVILDVVYNHFGPDGNFLTAFSRDYVSAQHRSEWGDTFNFDGPNSGPVREMVVSNARYWIDEYHFDGLRLDATQQIIDASPVHIIQELGQAARQAAADRQIYLVGENEPQDGRLARPASAGGCGLDALWNDDFHHSALVAATGRTEAYFLDHRGSAQEFVSALKYGFLYQGQHYWWQNQRRGTPALDLGSLRFVHFLENHDQVANTLRGLRLHQQTDPGTLRALTAVLLLGPSTPLLFQGQEFGSSAPFLYFADHHEELNTLVAQGRTKYLLQFRSAASPECAPYIPIPSRSDTFARCKLDWSEAERNAALLQLHTDLLRLRREDPTLSRRGRWDGAVLSPDAFVMRVFGSGHDDRLLIVNLGKDLRYQPAPEPLLAPPLQRGWTVLWSSEAPEYGGCGTAPPETNHGWLLPGRSAMLLAPHEAHDVCELSPILTPT